MYLKLTLPGLLEFVYFALQTGNVAKQWMTGETATKPETVIMRFSNSY